MGSGRGTFPRGSRRSDLKITGTSSAPTGRQTERERSASTGGGAARGSLCIEAPAKNTLNSCATPLRHIGQVRLDPIGTVVGERHPAHAQTCPQGTQTTSARLDRQMTQAIFDEHHLTQAYLFRLRLERKIKLMWDVFNPVDHLAAHGQMSALTTMILLGPFFFCKHTRTAPTRQSHLILPTYLINYPPSQSPIIYPARHCHNTCLAWANLRVCPK